MLLDTKSTSNEDINRSIALAYDDSLSKLEQDQVKEHLSYVLILLKEPNTYIPDIKEALRAMQSRQIKSWYEKPTGIVIISVIGSVASAGIAKHLGWI